MNIDTTLLREKFIIKEQQNSLQNKAMFIRCPSTRMYITLQAGNLPEEKYVVRTNNMHNCTRFVSKVIQNYEKHGPMAQRLLKGDWDELWDQALNSFERRYNPERWICVYHKGMPIFQSGKHQQFFDVIEKCDLVNKGKYDKSILMAENAFYKAGKDVKIIFESSVALVAMLDKSNIKCSMALRGPDKTTTFNYSLKPIEEGEVLSIYQGLSTAADFLEGVQLSFLIGLNNEKINRGIIERYSDEYKKLENARKRLGKLNAQISSMENRYQVRYRPERPDFESLIAQTEKFALDHIMADEDVYID